MIPYFEKIKLPLSGDTVTLKSGNTREMTFVTEDGEEIKSSSANPYQIEFNRVTNEDLY